MSQRHNILVIINIPQVDDGDVEREKLAGTINNFILDRIKEHEETYDENNMRDFVDHYIRVSHDDKAESSNIFTSNFVPFLVLQCA